MRSRGAALPGLPAVALMLASPVGCANVLGLDDYQSAIAALCVCDQLVPQFDGRCVEVLEERLTSTSTEERASFLELFEDSCSDSCELAETCYQHEALCTPAGARCGEDRECCGFPAGALCDETSRQCLP